MTLQRPRRADAARGSRLPALEIAAAFLSREQPLHDRLLCALERGGAIVGVDYRCLADGLARITRRRASQDALARSLPPAIGAPNAIWSEFWTDVPVTHGILAFNALGTDARGNVLELGGVSREKFEAKSTAARKRAYKVLQDAQEWPEATAPALASEAFNAFDRDALVTEIERMTIKSTYLTAKDCPGCA